MPSTVIFWIELSCWRKSYSNKATLLLGWNHCYKIIWSSSQSGWPLWNIHISNDNGSFTICRFFLSCITAKTFTRLDCIIIWVTGQVSYKKQDLLPLHEHMASPQFLVRFVWLIFLVFCVVFFVLFVSVLSLVYPLSLDWQFSIASLVLFKVS